MLRPIQIVSGSNLQLMMGCLPQIFAHILTKGVVSRCSIEAAIKVIAEKEVHSSDAWDLKALDQAVFILILKQELDLVNGQYRSKPIPLVVIADITVKSLASYDGEHIRKHTSRPRSY